MIKVSSASSLFQEKWLDSRGIFTLLLNAVERDQLNRQSMISSCNDNDLFMSQLIYLNVSDCRNVAINEIINAESSFCGDLETAEERMKQFATDHQRLKEIAAEQEKFTLRELLFTRRKEYKKLCRERDDIESMQIYVSRLMDVAYYRYHQITEKGKEDFLKELQEFLDEEQKKFT